MGFAIGDSAALRLTTDQRCHLLGQCIDLNLLPGTSQFSETPILEHTRSLREHNQTHQRRHHSHNPSATLRRLTPFHPRKPRYNRTRQVWAHLPPTPLDTEVYPKRLGIHGWLRHQGTSQTRRHGGTHPNTYHHMHQRNGLRGNLNHYADRKGGYTHDGPF